MLLLGTLLGTLFQLPLGLLLPTFFFASATASMTLTFFTGLLLLLLLNLGDRGIPDDGAISSAPPLPGVPSTDGENGTVLLRCSCERGEVARFDVPSTGAVALDWMLAAEGVLGLSEGKRANFNPVGVCGRGELRPKERFEVEAGIGEVTRDGGIEEEACADEAVLRGIGEGGAMLSGRPGDFPRGGM